MTVTSIASEPRFVAVLPADPRIPPGSDLAVEVTYTPTAAGADTATLALGFDDDPDPQLAVALDGSGLAATPDAPAPSHGGGCSASGGGTGAPLVLAMMALRLIRARRRRYARGSTPPHRRIRANELRVRSGTGARGGRREFTIDPRGAGHYRHDMRRIVLLVVLGLLGVHADARASIDLRLVEPANHVLDLGVVNVGQTSATGRIQIKNFGDALPGSPESSLISIQGSFVIVAEGGSLGPGETAYWDVVAMPTATEAGAGSADFSFVYDHGDDFLFIDVSVVCQIRRTPLDAEVAGFGAIGPGTTASRTITVTNTTTAPLTIDHLTLAAPAPFTVQLHTGSFPITVAPEAAFDLDVTFAPTVPDQFWDTELQAVLAGGATADVTELFGRSTGLVSLDASFNWDGVPLGATWVRQGTITNYGDTPQTITAIALTNPAEFGFTGIAVGTVIPPHTTLPIAGTFTPTGLATRFSDYTIRSTSGSPQPGLMNGEGVSPLVRITTEDAAPDDGVLDFGAVEVGSAPVTRKVTITNISGATLGTNRCEQFFEGALAATVDCPDFVALAPGASLEYGVVLTPGQVGDPIGRLTFSANGMNYTLEMRVYAHVTPHPLAVSATALAFADTVRHPTAPTTLTVTVTNHGSAPLAVPEAAITGAGFALVTAPPPGTIAPRASVSYVIGFAPTGAAAFDATLVLGPAAAPLAVIPLHGTGTLRPVSADPALHLGDSAIGAPVHRSVTVHNAGTEPAAITSLTTSDPRFVATLPADPTVPAGGDRTVEVTYTPTAAGPDTATLALGFDGDPDPQLTITLDGSGLAPLPGEPGPGHGGGCNALGDGPGGAPLLLLLAAARLLRRRPRA